MIPENLEGKSLYDFLVKNKKHIIKQKRKMFQKSGAIVSGNPSVISTKSKLGASKVLGSESDTSIVSEDLDTIRVKVIANTAMWFDHDQDVLLPNCWKKSISENKDVIPHVHDHVFSLDGKVGEVVDIYSQDIPLVELNIDKQGTANSLVFVTDIIKSYNPKIFNMYKNNKINQHSIGLVYDKIDLAINDKDYEDEYKNYIAYIDDIINKEDVDEYGYFWVVREIKLLENSCVVRGSNFLTNTIDNDYKSAEYNMVEEPTVVTPPSNDNSHLLELVSKFELKL